VTQRKSNLFLFIRKLGLVVAILGGSAFSQVAMQNWRIHFSTQGAVGISEDSTSVYMACANGIIQYHLDDHSVEMITAANGLSDLGISAIESDGYHVFIGYANGNIDLLEGNTITNIPWIKMADIAGNKDIHSFFFTDSMAYISSGVGLVIFDLEKREIADTYYPYSNPSVYASCVHRDTIYAATAAGIYYAPKNQSFLNDQNNWTKKTDLPSAVINGPFTHIADFGDKLLFVYKSSSFNGDTLYYLQDGILQKYGSDPLTIMDLKTTDTEACLTLYNSMQVFDVSMTQTHNIFQYLAGVPQPVSSIKKEGYYWLADQDHGLVKAFDSWNNDVVSGNSPYADACYRLDIQYGKVLVAGGGLTHNLANNYFQYGVYLFEDETWTNFNHETQDSIYTDKDWDFVTVAINPNNTNEFAFAGGIAKGGLKIVKDGVTITEVYTETNSTLEASASENEYAIGDMKYDDAGNLWIACMGVEPLKVLTPSGEWYSFSLGSNAKDKYPYRLTIDSDGNKWVAVTNASMIAFNENGTLADQSDDDVRIFSTSEGYGNLPSVFVKAIAEDIDGEMWVGTETGLVILYSRTNLYDGGYGEYDLDAILIEVGGEVEKLLGETSITAIAIDGGNRKWIGTGSSGVFCLSPDGTEEIYRFTAENSPLISNNILDIRIDHLSGEVYFATDKGLVSFRSDATISDENFASVKVFPNPVTPDFRGPITIQGLGYESDVKVTDVSGNIVYQTVSNGGTVIWDGLTLEGDRVQSGVYLVWTASVDGKGKNVAKILFIN
jgi:hypothetical protein